MAGEQVASGDKAVLSIFACTLQKDGSIVVETKPAFTVQINPSGYDHSYQIRYAQPKTAGSKGGEAKFDAVQPEKIVFKPLVIDGTGVVPGTDVPVKKQVETLRKAVYGYVGQKHEPPVVQVVWGTNLIFFGRCELLKFEYTLFTFSGEPLRAKVTLNFVRFTTPAEEIKDRAPSSPDLTHLVVVKAGDTLPLLCERIYRDPAYHLEVARINGLTLLRQLEPGARLRFPPLL
jgi:nucleoid-associated protein YgaU